jgi:hypothetical protein
VVGEELLYLIYRIDYKNCMMPVVHISIVVFYLEDEYHRFLLDAGNYLQEYEKS